MRYLGPRTLGGVSDCPAQLHTLIVNYGCSILSPPLKLTLCSITTLIKAFCASASAPEIEPIANDMFLPRFLYTITVLTQHVASEYLRLLESVHMHFARYAISLPSYQGVKDDIFARLVWLFRERSRMRSKINSTDKSSQT